MITRPLGSTGLVVSRIGVGLAALGRPGYINLGHAEDLAADYRLEAMEERACAVFDAARAAGVRYFDAARSYGRGEEFLGGWLRARGVPPGSVTVGSKWGYTYTAGWSVDAEVHEVKEHTLAVLERQWRESRAALGDHLALYQIHSATLESGVLDRRVVLGELARLKGAGVRIGLSLTGPDQARTLDRAMTVETDGRRLFDCVQATWNLLEPSAGEALARAHDAGLGVIVKEGLANGRLTARNREPELAARRRLLGQTAARLDLSVDALALAAVLAEPWADVVLSGAATLPHLHSNLAAGNVVLDEETRRTLASLREPAPEYWSRRSRLTWN